MFCKNCGTANPDGARFCKGCGSALDAAPAGGAQTAGGYGAAPVYSRPAYSTVPMTADRGCKDFFRKLRMTSADQFGNFTGKHSTFADSLQECPEYPAQFLFIIMIGPDIQHQSIVRSVAEQALIALVRLKNKIFSIPGTVIPRK